MRIEGYGCKFTPGQMHPVEYGNTVFVSRFYGMRQGWIRFGGTGSREEYGYIQGSKSWEQITVDPLLSFFRVKTHLCQINRRMAR